MCGEIGTHMTTFIGRDEEHLRCEGLEADDVVHNWVATPLVSNDENR